MYGFHYIDEEFSEGRLKVYDKRIMKDLRQAIEFYRSEYGKLPFSEAPMEVIRSEGEWLSVIMNESDDLNPKGFRFFDPPPFAKTAKGRGLHKRNGELSLTDIWGRMYYVIMDSDGDGFIANPETVTNLSNQEFPAKINDVALLYSAGEDGNPNTWEDNVCSWR